MRQIGGGPRVPGTGDSSLEALNSLFAREGLEEITTHDDRRYADLFEFRRFLAGADANLQSDHRDDYGIAGERPCETDRVSAGGGASWSRRVAHSAARMLSRQTCQSDALYLRNCCT